MRLPHSDSHLLAAFRAVVAERNAARGKATMFGWLQRYAALVTFVVLIVSGVILRLMPDDWLPWHWLSSIVHMLADSLIVAGILGVTVDTFLKKALLRDVGSIFIGWALPHEVKTHIREVSETTLVRRSHQVHFKLTLDGNEVIADVCESFGVYNYGTGIEAYCSQLSLDLHEKPDRESVRCERIHGEDAKSWGADKLRKWMKEEEGVVTWGTPKIRLLPQDGDDPNLKPACTVRWNYRLRLPVHYSTVISFGSPCIGATVTADWPAGLRFNCQADKSTKHAKGSTRWHYDRLYMKGQVLRVQWEPTAAPPEGKVET